MAVCLTSHEAVMYGIIDPKFNCAVPPWPRGPNVDRRDEVPRIEFNTKAEFTEWWQGMTKPSKYVVYTTQTSEVILEPKTSTSPVRFGYLRAMTREVFQEVIDELRQAGYSIYACGNYEWKSDMIVGYAKGR